MPGSASNSTENIILDLLFGNTLPSGFTRPSDWDNYYVALFTTMPGEDGTGGVEVTGGNYSRFAIANTSGNWRRVNNVASNRNTIEFPVASAPWTNIRGAALFHQASGGTMRFSCTLPAPVTVQAGDTFRIPVGELSITLD